MRYYVHDPKSGKFFTRHLGFYTYDHNEATNFRSYSAASSCARMYRGSVVIL